MGGEGEQEAEAVRARSRHARLVAETTRRLMHCAA